MKTWFLVRNLSIRSAPYATAAALGVAVYVRSVTGPFIWDDWVLIEQLKQRASGGVLGIFTSGFLFRLFGGGADFYRPVITASFVLDHAVWQTRTLGYHLVNLALHVVCILSVALLTWLALRNRTAAIAAAFLFAVHPAHTQSVAWISGRTDLFCAVFLFAGLSAYVAYHESRRKSFLALSLFLVLLAMLSKELALLVPILAPLLAWARGERSYRRLILDAFPFLILAGVFFAVRSVILPGSEPAAILVPARLRAAIIAYSVFTHFQILMLPHTARLGYGLTADALLSPKTFVMAFTLAILTWSFWANRRRSPVPFFGICWFLVTILPVSGLPGPYATGMVAERFLYIPSLGLAAVFGWLAASTLERQASAVRVLGTGAILFVIAVFSLLSASRSALYADEVRFWKHFVADTQFTPMGHYNLGNAYHRYGENREAIEAYRRAIELAPDMAKAHYGLGEAYAELGRYDRAIEGFARAGELAPDDPGPQKALESVLEQERTQRRSLDTARAPH